MRNLKNFKCAFFTIFGNKGQKRKGSEKREEWISTMKLIFLDTKAYGSVVIYCDLLRIADFMQSVLNLETL